MESPQSVVSPFKGSSLFAGPEKHKADPFAQNARCLLGGSEFGSKEAVGCNFETAIGVLDVYIHQARDIHNICIYHKQDVYAKICLTSVPENTVSTQIINGGGKNPVFNEKLRLNVHTVDSTLKCEIWMLSRVRNYLEDQLLGFALVPLSEILINNGKLEKEFSLSSTDLFHSPAGFVLLSLSYAGVSPEVIALSAMSSSNERQESEPSELYKIEFPDPKIVCENHMMVSEYFGIPCANLDCQSSESLVSSDTEPSSEIGAPLVESFSTGTVDSNQLLNHDSPPSSSLSTNGSSSHPASGKSYDAPRVSKKAPNQEFVSPCKENLKDKTEDVGDAESNASGGESGGSIPKPVIKVNIEPGPNLVQQEIVDMYMKSMHESLAKMKLPMDIENVPADSGNSSLEQKLQTSKNNGSRVFYGSRAFF